MISDIAANLDNQEWWALAACAKVDPAIFTTDTAGPPSYAAAKRVCASCPVQPACLRDALNRKIVEIDDRDQLFIAGCTPAQINELRVKHQRRRAS